MIMKTLKVFFLIFSLAVTLAAARPQAPAADTNPTQTSPAGKTVRTILDQLEKAGKKYSAIRADLEYVVVNRKLGDSETRTGWIAYKSAATDNQSPAMFRIHFETLRQEGGPKIRDRVDYAFDGKWLTVKKHRIKQIIRYQVVADGNDKNEKKPEPLKLGKGPFPLPFSQQADDMLKHFHITPRPCSETTPKNTDYLKLVPREQYKKKINFVRMEMWVDRKLHLPIKIICRDYSKNVTTVKFLDISTPKDFGKADKKMFHLPRKPGWSYTEKPGVSD